MTKFIIVRHGEADFIGIKDQQFKNFNSVLAPLTENGINKINSLLINPIILDSELIIASPYTRTMQTAAILSRGLDIPLITEYNLHEWLATKDHSNFSPIYFKMAYSQAKIEELSGAEGTLEGVETFDNVRERLYETLIKYNDHTKVIVVTHKLCTNILFNGKVKLGCGDYYVTDSEEVEKNYVLRKKS